MAESVFCKNCFNSHKFPCLIEIDEEKVFWTYCDNCNGWTRQGDSPDILRFIESLNLNPNQERMYKRWVFAITVNEYDPTSETLKTCVQLHNISYEVYKPEVDFYD